MLTLARSWTYLLFFGLLLIAIGLGLRWLGLPSPTIKLLDADLQVREGEPSMGSAKMGMDEVRTLVSREYYIRAKVFSCEKEGNFYPAEILYDGIAFDEFMILNKKFREYNGDYINLQFLLPSEIVNRYEDPCLRIYGGQMLGFGRVNSNVVKVIRD